MLSARGAVKYQFAKNAGILYNRGMKSKQTKFIIGIIVAITIVVLFGIFSSKSDKISSGKYDQFAQCLSTNGAKFYGAFWCPHCQKQKEIFGSSKKFLPYIECSNLDGKTQTQICIDKGIKSYPTWIFADESVISGEATFEQLSEKTQCPLPQ